MAMNIETPLLAIRTALIASVVSAWGIVAGNVHTAPNPTEPENLPSGVISALPAAWVLVGLTEPMTAEQVQRSAGFGKVSFLIPCVVIGRFVLPSSGNIDTEKYTKGQNFLNLLAAVSTVYAGYRYWDVVLNYAEPPDYVNGFYEISVSWKSEAITDA